VFSVFRSNIFKDCVPISQNPVFAVQLSILPFSGRVSQCFQVLSMQHVVLQNEVNSVAVVARRTIVLLTRSMQHLAQSLIWDIITPFIYVQRHDTI